MNENASINAPDAADAKRHRLAGTVLTESLRIIDLGRVAYAPALAKQREVHAAVVAGDAAPTVLLVEHDPVITVSRRKGAASHLLAPPDRLAAMGISVEETDRGGDITYHGPGQLVAYPIVRLADLGLNIARYMRLLEEIVIDTLKPFGITGERDACATGVWVRMPGAALATPAQSHSEAAPDACVFASPTTAKIAALGVRVSRGVTLHGVALNVTTDLSHFNTIVPCGLLNRSVTSMQQLLGEETPPMEEVKRAMSAALRRHLAATAR